MSSDRTPAPPVSPTLSFGDFLPFEDYMLLAEHTLSGGADKSNEWREERMRLLDVVFGKAMQGFLSALRNEGRLEKIRGGEGHQIDFLTTWNEMVETGFDKEDAQSQRRRWNSLTGKLGHHFSFSAIYPARKAHEKGEDVSGMHRPAYEAMVARMDGGRIEWWEMSSEHYCFVTDERYQMELDGWKIRLGKHDYSTKDGDFLEIQPIEPPSVVELEVEFKTGELLIADWFRIPEFTELTREGESKRPSINSSRGCIAQTEAYLNEHGFVSVAVGNTSPDVLKIDGTLTFAYVDEDGEEGWPEGVEKLGDTCTDLWWVTVIERAKLVELVAKSVGADEAERKVAEYLAEDGYGLTRLTVEPGRYHLYFHGETSSFGDSFHSPDLSIPSAVEPMFVLSPRKLTLEQKPGAEAEATPGMRQ